MPGFGRDDEFSRLICEDFAGDRLAPYENVVASFFLLSERDLDLQQPLGCVRFGLGTLQVDALLILVPFGHGDGVFDVSPDQFCG